MLHSQPGRATLQGSSARARSGGGGSEGSTCSPSHKANGWAVGTRHRVYAQLEQAQPSRATGHLSRQPSTQGLSCLQDGIQRSPVLGSPHPAGRYTHQVYTPDTRARHTDHLDTLHMCTRYTSHNHQVHPPEAQRVSGLEPRVERLLGATESRALSRGYCPGLVA